MASLSTKCRTGSRDVVGAFVCLPASKCYRFWLIVACILSTGLLSMALPFGSRGPENRARQQAKSAQTGTRAWPQARRMASGEVSDWDSPGNRRDCTNDDHASLGPDARSIGDVGREYVRQKGNIYFSKEALAQDLLAKDDRAIEHLNVFLELPPDLGDLAVDKDGVMPSVVAERMAALDIIGFLAAPDSALVFGDQANEDARVSLRRLCEMKIPATVSLDQRKVMVAEKYDAFVAMAHADSAKAYSAYRSLANDAQRAVIAPALMTALVEQGIARVNVDAEFFRRAHGL